MYEGIHGLDPPLDGVVHRTLQRFLYLIGVVRPVVMEDTGRKSLNLGPHLMGSYVQCSELSFLRRPSQLGAMPASRDEIDYYWALFRELA